MPDPNQANGPMVPFAEAFVAGPSSDSMRYVHPLTNIQLSHEELAQDILTEWVVPTADGALLAWASAQQTTIAYSQWTMRELDVSSAMVLIRRRFHSGQLDQMQSVSQCPDLAKLATLAAMLKMPQGSPI
jgi:hypothetical protein